MSITTDIGEVDEALDAGDVMAALDRYPGPLLPQSISPAVGRLRTEMTMTLRAAVLATGDPAVLRRWLNSPDGRDDRDGWRALHDGTLPGSVQQAQAHGRLAGLDIDLA